MGNTKLQTNPIVINIIGDSKQVFSVFLRVFLAQKRLTDKQIVVATSLVERYAQYINDGVKEPYASQILFSTENRKEMAKEVGISAPHLNNTFISLQAKDILAKDDKAYMINPSLLPSSKLIFNFTIAKQRPAHKGSSTKAKPAAKESERGDSKPVPVSQENNTVPQV